MNKSRISVLIVEDDTSHGKAMLEAFKRAGYQAILSNSSVQALLFCQRQEIRCVISDCMLPKMNGIDMVVEMKKLMVTPPKVFLISGIFKDKNFIKTSLAKTEALAFLAKPFDVKDLLAHVEEAFQDDADSSDDPPLIRLYRDETMDDTALTQLLSTEGTLHGVHLPMLFKRMMAADLTGELTMITEGGAINAVGFYKGRIFSVRTPDKDTYFGSLAVTFGFVSPEDVMEALREQGGKLLGQRLIDSMSLSPHAINVILGEQLALRLSQTVSGDVVSLQWQLKKFPEPNHILDKQRYDILLNDWMRSKIDPEWIKPLFSKWGTFKLLGEYHTRIGNAETINDLMANSEFGDDKDVLFLFRQLLNGNATIGGRGNETRDFTFLENRLNQILGNYKTQNFFQILGITEKAHSLELSRAMNDLRQTFDPNTLPSGTPPGVRIKATKVFQQIELAYKTLSDDALRTQYVMERQNKRSSQLLENEPIYRAAILELVSGQAKRAVRRFEKLLAEKLEFKELRAYYIWAGLKSDKHFSAMSLDQVPPEERHSAPYMMAKGIWHRQRGQASKALDAFRTAHVLDPRLTVAYSELEALRADLERKGASRALIREVSNVLETFPGKSRRGA